MTKNTIKDLNDHLFAQLERLGNEELDEAGVNKEVLRTGAIVNAANKIMENGKLVIEAEKIKQEFMLPQNPLLLLSGTSD